MLYRPWLVFPALCLAVGMICTVPDSATAQDSDSTFRDLVRKHFSLRSRPQQDTSPYQTQLAEAIGAEEGLDGVVALEYTVLLRNGELEKPVDPKGYEFKVGDEIRIKIQPMNDMYIYIYHEGASGHRVCLLPETDERVPLAKANQSLVLPPDGYFEFSDPPGSETLVVVATEKPLDDLASLANVVFQKPDTELTEDEKKIKAQLKGRVEKTLQSIRRRQTTGTTYRDAFSSETLKKVAAEAKEKNTTRAVFEEPPSGKNGSTFTMLANYKKDGGRLDLFVSIPLKSHR